LIARSYVEQSNFDRSKLCSTVNETLIARNYVVKFALWMILTC